MYKIIYKNKTLYRLNSITVPSTTVTHIYTNTHTHIYTSKLENGSSIAHSSTFFIILLSEFLPDIRSESCYTFLLTLDWEKWVLLIDSYSLKKKLSICSYHIKESEFGYVVKWISHSILPKNLNMKTSIVKMVSFLFRNVWKLSQELNLYRKNKSVFYDNS